MINTIFNDEHYKPGDWWNAKGERYLKILQWGRKYPTRFVEEILEIQLTDQHDGLLYWETI